MYKSKMLYNEPVSSTQSFGLPYILSYHAVPNIIFKQVQNIL
jgi:hypothetical protein